MSRVPNEKELELLNGDIMALEKYCLQRFSGFTAFEERIDGVSIKISKEVGDNKGAAGQADHYGKILTIREDMMMSCDKDRRSILYHEIGHLLFGMKNIDKSVTMKIAKIVFETVKNNKNILDGKPEQYIRGLYLLEEYIVEKFAVNAACYTTNSKIQIYKNCMHVISGRYMYDTSFAGGYGVFETLCDRLIEKTYRNFDTLLAECLNSTFYLDLFEKYDKVELLRILGEFGYIYDTLMMYAKDRTIRSASQTQKVLESISKNIDGIKTEHSHSSLGEESDSR